MQLPTQCIYVYGTKHIFKVSHALKKEPTLRELKETFGMAIVVQM
jgi:tRNA threonylcarbamoyladenosine modification (KEOPS) complex Cgi121 subunit